jgi:hypothetical protein
MTHPSLPRPDATRLRSAWCALDALSNPEKQALEAGSMLHRIGEILATGGWHCDADCGACSGPLEDDRSAVCHACAKEPF